MDSDTYYSIKLNSQCNGKVPIAYQSGGKEQLHIPFQFSMVGRVITVEVKQNYAIQCTYLPYQKAVNTYRTIL